MHTQSTKRNDDISIKGRFTRNKLQWYLNDIKSSQTTNGDYLRVNACLQITDGDQKEFLPYGGNMLKI